MASGTGPAAAGAAPSSTRMGSGRGRAKPIRPGQRRRRRRETASAYTLLIPSFIGVGVFLLVPMLVVAVLSFIEWDLISPAEFVGFENWTRIFGDRKFWNSLLVTAKFVLMAIPASVILGLLIAVALNRHLPGRALLRVIYVLPWVCAPLALGVVWRWLFDPSTGLINAIIGRRIEWMSDVNLALPAVAFVYVWSKIGYISLFFLAGLQNIPQAVYEAAKIDGAGLFTMLLRITMPLLRPTSFFILVTEIVASFQVFDLVYGLTGSARGYPGGTTDVIAARIYQEAFVSLNFGTASVMALILFAVLVIITIAQQRYFAPRMTYDMS
ncbi:MAG TPA: sugar ABC transporter permease [Actinomycetaceae bacterium]|nr:sugar ABC transporter permease [Actinomycetaceae bacterium]